MEKILLVLGASSDVGIAYIKKYHGRYDKIVGTYYTHKEELEKLRDGLGDKLEIYRLNLLQQDEIDIFAGYLAGNRLMPGYVLHLPARKTSMIRAYESESELYRTDFELEVVSIMRLLKTILPAMQEAKFGRICFMLSSVTKNPIAFQSSYMISKYALLGAMKALAIEFAAKKITVNAVSPSMIDTKFIAETSELAKKKRISTSPLKRLAVPDDVTGALAFLLDENNEFMTGENLLIAGGGILCG